MRLHLLLLSILLLMGCQSPSTIPPTASHQDSSATLEEFSKTAAKFNAVVAVPPWETTAEELKTSFERSIAAANAALDQIGRLPPAQLSFENTIRALDDISYQAGLVASRGGVIKETSQNAALRDAATEAIKAFEEWAVGLDYREDVYAAVKALAAKNPEVNGEDARLLEETLRDYKRAGLELPKDKRAEVEQWRKELSRLSTDFDSNITKAQKAVPFTRAQLKGVPDSFLDQPAVKTGDDQYTVMANITWHYTTVMDNAAAEESRRKLLVARETLALDVNVPILKQILALRQKIATQLGYKSWADYKIEPKMAKTAATADEFLQRLKIGLEPKFREELDAFRQIKVKETGDANARINVWDIRYFTNQLKKEKYAVDSEKLRDFFPYQKVLQGMFDIYQKIFTLRITEVSPPYKWVEDLRLFAVADASTGEPLGLFYLDMFPREGKYNHFAQFGIVDGKELAGGKYQRPTVALICNFPAPQGDKPALLTHSEVETLFHEFGHAMHSVLTRARYARFSGTSVPRDFVEAPSQMLENWAWDKKVLDGFAAHYQDPTRKIPQDILQQLKAAKLATVATYYRRQISFALVDLALHSGIDSETNLVEFSNKIVSDVYVDTPKETGFVAYFGHLTGYDAGYYGYAWADAIAADMATVFEQAPNKYFDVTVGHRLRDEIYAPGDSRDVTISIRRFLGRPQSIDPFLKTLGLGASP